MLSLVALMIFTTPGCEEEFPPYTEPANVLQGELQLVAPETVSVHSDLSGYFFNDLLILKTTITNVHDDLLQGRARIAGEISLQSFSQVPRAFAVPLTLGDLRTPPVAQGNIAIGPGRKAEFSVLWVPYATDGTIVFAGLPYAQVGPDKMYGPIDFIAYADVQLFERVQPFRLPSVEFRLVFKVSE